MLVFSIKKIRISKEIVELLYSTILFFTVFDGVRDHFQYSKYLSVIRDCSIFLLAFIVVLKFKWHFNIFHVDSIGMVLFVCAVIALPINIILTPEVVSYHKNLVRTYYPFFDFVLLGRFANLFILIYLYSNYQKLTGNGYEKLFRKLLILSVGYVVWGVITYLIHVPLFAFRPWWGRISIGYPTMDAQVLCYAILAVLFIVKMNSFKTFSFLMVIIIGIVMQSTATGIITLSFVTVFTILYRKRISCNRKMLSLYLLLGAGCIIALFIYLMARYGELFREFQYLIGYKLQEAFGLVGADESKSIMARQKQIHDIMQVYNNPFHLIFGAGSVLGYLVENQYVHMIRSFGYFGLVVFILWGSYLFVFGIVKNKGLGYLMIANVVIFYLTSYSLITTYLTPIESCFALFYAFGRGDRQIRYSPDECLEKC